MRIMLFVLAVLVLPVTASAADGVPQPPALEQRQASARPVNPDDVRTRPGYPIEAVASGLTYATSVAIAPGGEVYVGEAGGHTYGTEPDKAPPARILPVMPDGTTRVVFEQNVPIPAIRDAQSEAAIPEGVIAPITGLTWRDGLLYVSHRTRISTLDPATGQFRTIVRGLPAWGEFQNNKPIFGPDGKMYFFVSTQGNSGVIGEHMMKVLDVYNKRDKHEIPCADVALTGEDFEVPNLFTPEPNDKKLTGVYVPFGVTTFPGQVIPGQIPCNGAFFKANAGRERP